MNKFNDILISYKKKLTYFNYSDRTINIYYHYVTKSLIKVDKYPQHITSFDFESYLLNYNFSSISQQNQIINAIKFLYEKVLNKKYKKEYFRNYII